ncbi:YIP1 family protein [Candidatus Sumerlaeota bacterium]|nr:YIP1 family protein [Candidatus Sumerlaeota bacterium]
MNDSDGIPPSSPSSAPPPPEAAHDARQLEIATPAWDTSLSLPAFFHTVPEILFYPAATFRFMRSSGGIVSAFLFFLLCILLTLPVQLFLFRESLPLSIDYLRQLGAEETLLRTLESLRSRSLLSLVVVSLPGVAFSPLLRALAIHLILAVFRLAHRTFGSTFRVLCYSRGATAPLWLIPYCVGPVLGITWEFSCTVIGLSEQHGISRWAAAMVVIVAGFAAFLCCCGTTFGVLILSAPLSGSSLFAPQ